MKRNPKQDANLKPIRSGDLTPEELKRRQHNGGVKGSEARRRKRDCKESIQLLLSMAAQGNLEANLRSLGYEEDEWTNINALNARLFTKAMSGDIEAYKLLMKMGGMDPEEERRERESVSSDRRRDQELEYKAQALTGNRPTQVAVNTQDEDGKNDVVIYLPELEDEEDCEPDPESDPEQE